MFFLIAAAQTLVHQLTLRFRIQAQRLEIRSGLIFRSARTLGPDRIQSATLVRNPFHRALGLAEVRIEMAGDLRTEGLLSALSLDEAVSLLRDLDALRGAVQDQPGAPVEDDLHRVGVLEIVGHGLSSRQGGVMGFLVLLVMEVLKQSGARELPPELLGPGFLTGLVLTAFVLGWLLALGGAFLTLYRYRLTRHGDRLRTEQGLLTRRRVELRIPRLQVVRVDEGFLRRRMGYGAILLQTAGIAAGPEGVRRADADVPMVPRHRLAELCRLFLPNLDLDRWEALEARDSTRCLKRPPMSVLVMGLADALLRGLLLLGAGVAILGSFGALLSAFLLPLLLLGAWLDWAWQGWSLEDGFIIARRGFWMRRTWIVPLGRVQSLLRLQGPALRLLGLGRVGVRMAASRVLLPLMPWGEAERVLAAIAAWRREPRPSPAGEA
jgi:putative membrane protein